MRKPDNRIGLHPDPGFATVKLVTGGWAVPARIAKDGDVFRFEIDGDASYPPMTEAEISDLISGWVTGGAPNPIARLLLYGRYVDEATWAHRNATRVWALEHNPQHPAATPMKRIDTRLLRPEDF